MFLKFIFAPKCEVFFLKGIYVLPDKSKILTIVWSACTLKEFYAVFLVFFGWENLDNQTNCSKLIKLWGRKHCSYFNYKQPFRHLLVILQ